MIMSAENLLDLNVDTLFEQHSVAEIEIVQRKMQATVEQKREELRMMVGERYRDLLQAADTISSMRDSSQKLIAQVESISADCRSLNEQQLIGFETNDSVDLLRNRNANKQLNNYFSTMVQIKLLTSLPELIWSHIDQERFYAATELFIFSRHISTGLQLDVNNSLMQHLPVAKKQWELLQPFHVTIKQSLIAVLEREELSADVAVDCFLSLLLLEKNNLSNIFKTFLQLRCAAFLNCLNAVESGESGNRRVKERILASLKVLNGTIDLTEKCFLANALIFKRLAELSDVNAPPTVMLMDASDTQFTYILPDIIANFRPIFEAQALESNQIRTALDQWLADIKRIAGVQLKQIFELVSAMNTIQDIKATANGYRKQSNYSTLVAQLKLPQALDFYEEHYVPLINQRVRDIIHNSWTAAMQMAFEALEHALHNVTISPSSIWEEQASDLPLSLAEALSEDRKIKKLLMKTKGYDGVIISICAEFDKQLAGIVSEMNLLLEEKHTKTEDKVALIEFLRDTSQTKMTDFLCKIKSLQLLPQQRHELLLAVRLCVAILELCPHLKICFCQQSSWRQWVLNTPHNFDYWKRICLLLEEEVLGFWQQIVQGILEENHSAQQLPQAVTHEVILRDFVNWETVTLEQNDDEDNTLQSHFRIPNQPSISMQSYLFALIRLLNKTVPQTLPLKVLHNLNQQLLAQLATHYEQLTTLASTTSSQNVALQLYFDVKFLQTIFSISRDERALYERYYALQNKLRDIIDPFDFELFAEHIVANVKRAVVRLSAQLGVLVPKTPHALTSSAVVVQEKDPNVLCISACSSKSTLWFPLLPIVAPNVSSSSLMVESRTIAPTQELEKETSPSPSTRKPTTARKADSSKSKSGAASFFGAMSQEWFR